MVLESLDSSSDRFVAGFCTGVDGHSDPGKDLFNLAWLKTNDQI